MGTRGRGTKVEVSAVCVWEGPGTPPEANSYSLFGMLWGREFPSLN